MRPITSAALAALLSTGLAGGALAQSTDLDTTTGVTGEAGAEAMPSTGAETAADPLATGEVGTSLDADMSAGTDLTAQAGAEADIDAGFDNYGQVIASLQSNGMADPSADLAGVTEETDISVVTLSSLDGEASGEAEALDQALAEQETVVSDVRSAIEANPVLADAIEADGYSVDDVVAWDVSSDESVTFVIDDRS